VTPPTTWRGPGSRRHSTIWSKQARAEGLEARACLRRGLADQEIVALARDERADLIVIGTHGRAGMSRMLLGSVTDRVVRLAPCPVLTVREPDGELAA